MDRGRSRCIKGWTTDVVKRLTWTKSTRIKVSTSEGREERHRIHVASCLEKSSHQWWCCSIMFSSQSMQTSTRKFQTSSCCPLLANSGLLVLFPSRTAKGTKSRFCDHGVENSPDPTMQMTWRSFRTAHFHRPPCWRAVIHAKRGPTNPRVQRQSYRSRSWK